VEAAVEEAAGARAPNVYEFYRGYLKGLLDSLLRCNVEEEHPWLDGLVDHLVASIIADTLKEAGCTTGGLNRS